MNKDCFDNDLIEYVNFMINELSYIIIRRDLSIKYRYKIYKRLNNRLNIIYFNLFNKYDI